MDLLTRENFRKLVFERDNHQCVVCNAIGEVCQNTTLDAHHIIDRKCFEDGGYYLNNGVSLCSKHHLSAENGEFLPDQLREFAKISQKVLPTGFDPEKCYNKWGDIINYRQNDRFKFPHTPHLPWSAGVSGDDIIAETLENFSGKRVIVTLKMDGENTTIYSDGYYHARSIDSNNHPSRDWCKYFLSSIAYDMPFEWRICGENLYAEHTIHYTNLKSYFYTFSIWNEHNISIDWDQLVEWCDLLGLCHVPVLYDGIWDEKIVQSIYQHKYDGNEMEGYVVRLADSIPFEEFGISTAKYVDGRFKKALSAQEYGFWLNKHKFGIIKNELEK
jgi:hypothetical protein